MQIPDIIELEDRLDNSLERDLVKMEHVRMRVTHEAINADLVDMEFIELKFIFDRRMVFLVMHFGTADWIHPQFITTIVI